MFKSKSLRQRLVITTVVIVTVTSTLFAAALMALKQRLEEVTFGNTVRGHLELLLDDPGAAHELLHPVFDEWSYVTGADVASLPEHIRNLPAGSYHSIFIKDRFYQMQIAGEGADKVFLMYDISDWEAQEHELLIMLFYGVVVVMGLAVFLASRAASSVLAPVQKLSTRLAMIEPGQRNVRIAGDFAEHDIGQIAAAFDSYSQRIDQFVERESSFTAAASHELRTPLSVMMGAVDVIEASQPSPAAQRALARIRRACAEMQAFVEATLFLSREKDSGIKQSSTSNVNSVIKQLIEDNQPGISAANIHVLSELSSELVLDVPESIVKITLGNLLRNAIEHTPGGTISLLLHERLFVIKDTGEGIDSRELPHIFDRSYTSKACGTGLGLNMVKRICDRYSWVLNIESVLGEGTVVTLDFGISA